MSTGLDLEELDILESVRRGLAPNASRIHASLDKLNLYSKGGVGDTEVLSPFFDVKLCKSCLSLFLCMRRGAS